MQGGVAPKNPHHKNGYFYCLTVRERARYELRATLQAREFSQRLKVALAGVPSFIERREDADRYLSEATELFGMDVFEVAECSPL